ncbi:hypothetical protein H6F67_26370 [Microcoleus sp. FACHB-1515]|uniref:hypothetical protein n=1 Tax=Cyanophyceae TaxID=3028117 RepID=UPI0016874979|nr:hypothetical protein [Microcoleus sp. FACHB-1515]MBD2093375.1 hypothetical protein [Microcoleus sp. FACHB-1515]
MNKGFGSSSCNQPSKWSKQRQVIANLKQHRDRILGLAWLGYLKGGTGAILYTPIKDGGNIDYIQRSRIDDAEVRQMLDQNNPQRAAVVLYSHGNSYTIVTLLGPKSPPECYVELPAELRNRQQAQG